MLNADVIGISIPACVKSLMVVLISAIPAGMQYCFWFAILIERVSLSTTMALIPIICSGTGEITKGYVCGPTGSTLTYVKTPIYHLPIIAPTVATVSFWIPCD